jgi:threonine dehydrogenase-like Zn-dependent dehydrogenase
MCRNGLYTECGIKQRHGYAQELYRLEPEFAIPVDASLGDLGVLVEPTSVVGKACVLCLHFLKRTEVPPRTALITGAGPLGLLAALATRQYGLETYVVDIVETGLKPELVRQIGAHYHAGPIRDLSIAPEVVIECTGVGDVLRQAVVLAAPGAVIALTGMSTAPGAAEVDLNVFNRNMVLTNKVLFGSVNAARSHYELAARLLSRTDPAWLHRLISRRVPRERWREAIDRQPDDVKVVLDFGVDGDS